MKIVHISNIDPAILEKVAFYACDLLANTNSSNATEFSETLKNLVSNNSVFEAIDLIVSEHTLYFQKLNASGNTIVTILYHYRSVYYLNLDCISFFQSIICVCFILEDTDISDIIISIFSSITSSTSYSSKRLNW